MRIMATPNRRINDLIEPQEHQEIIIPADSVEPNNLEDFINFYV